MASSPPLVIDFATKAPSSPSDPGAAYIPPPRSAAYIPDARSRPVKKKASNYKAAAQSYYRAISNAPFHHRAFVCVVLLQFFLLVLERIVLIVFGFQSAQGNADLQHEQIWFFVLAVVTSFFAALNGLYALLRTNAYSLVVFFMTSSLLILRCIVDYANRSDECSEDRSSSVCLAFLVLSLLLTIISMVLAALAYPDLRWKRYKAIGSFVQTRELFSKYEIFRAAVSLDLQNSIINLATACIFFSGRDLSAQKFGLGAGIALFVVEIVWDRAGAIAVRRESRPAMYLFWALSPLLPCYLLWAMITAAATKLQLLGRLAAQPSLWGTALFFCLLAIVVRIVSVYYSHLLYSAFGERYKGVRKLLQADNMALNFEKGRIRSPSEKQQQAAAEEKKRGGSVAAQGKSQEIKKSAGVGASATIGAAVATGGAMPDKRRSSRALVAGSSSNNSNNAGGKASAAGDATSVVRNPFAAGVEGAASGAPPIRADAPSSSSSSPASAPAPAPARYHPPLAPSLSELELHLGPEDAFPAYNKNRAPSIPRPPANNAAGNEGADDDGGDGEEEYYYGDGEEQDQEEGDGDGEYDDGEDHDGEDGYEEREEEDDGGGGQYGGYGYDDHDDDGGGAVEDGLGHAAVQMTPLQSPRYGEDNYSRSQRVAALQQQAAQQQAAPRSIPNAAAPVLRPQEQQQQASLALPASYGIATGATPSGMSFNAKMGSVGGGSGGVSDSTAAKAVAARRYGR